MTHDCDTCRNMHPELMIDGCAADEFISMSEKQQLAFWKACEVPCPYWKAKEA